MGDHARIKLKPFALAAATIASVSVITVLGAPPASPVRFAPHDIDAAFRGGYSVAVADFNNDGKTDRLSNWVVG
jgi:hypothetical protein